VLDEMHDPILAALLRDRGHDVVSVADNAKLRSVPDPELIAWAASEGRWIVTENIRDFRRLMQVAEEAGRYRFGVVLTDAQTFPRSRRKIARLVDALDVLLTETAAENAPPEIWLRPAPERVGGVRE
jgi:hypothetical protein